MLRAAAPKGFQRRIVVLSRHAHRTVEVMVWEAIIYGTRLRLLFIRGNTIAVCYLEDKLQPTLFPYQDGHLERNNARAHIVR